MWNTQIIRPNYSSYPTRNICFFLSIFMMLLFFRGCKPRFFTCWLRFNRISSSFFLFACHTVDRPQAFFVKALGRSVWPPMCQDCKALFRFWTLYSAGFAWKDFAFLILTLTGRGRIMCVMEKWSFLCKGNEINRGKWHHEPGEPAAVAGCVVMAVTQILLHVVASLKNVPRSMPCPWRIRRPAVFTSLPVTPVMPGTLGMMKMRTSHLYRPWTLRWPRPQQHRCWRTTAGFVWNLSDLRWLWMKYQTTAKLSNLIVRLNYPELVRALLF